MSGFWFRIGFLYPLSPSLALPAKRTNRTAIFRNTAAEAPIREVSIDFLGYSDEEVSYFNIYIRPSRLFANDLLKAYAIFFNIDPGTDPHIKRELFDTPNGYISFDLNSGEYSLFAKLIEFIEFLCQQYKVNNFLEDIIAELRQLANWVKPKMSFLSCTPVHFISEKFPTEEKEHSNQLLTLLSDTKLIFLKRHFSKTAIIPESQQNDDYLQLCDIFPILAQGLLESICDDMHGISPPQNEHKEVDESEALAVIESELHTLDRKFDQLLVMAERVNAFDSTGYTPLHYALFLTAEEVEKLLRYGAHPLFLAPHAGKRYITAYELALQQAEKGKGIDIFQTLQSSMTHVERPLKKSIMGLRVIDTRIESTDKSVTTTFISSNHDPIFTELKSSVHQTAQEQEQLLTMFHENFEGDEGEHAECEEDFKEFLGEKNTYIEIFYVKSSTGNQPIGFNVLSILEIDNQIFLHCAYSALRVNYRSLGIMPLLIMRLGFALDNLFPNRKVGIFSNVIHYNSYRLIENLLHWPKYQSPHVEKLIKKILNNIDENFQYVHDIIKCFVRDGTKVKGEYYIKGQNHLAQKHLYDRILAFVNGAPDYLRGTPMLFYIGDDSFFKFASLLSHLGIDFQAHIISLSQHFAPLAPFPAPAKPHQLQKKYFVKNSTFLFFYNISKPIELAVSSTMNPKQKHKRVGSPM